MAIDLGNTIQNIIDNDTFREIFDNFVGGATFLNLLVLAAKNANTVRDAFRPNMTIKEPYEAVLSLLYKKIEECEKLGLEYNAGKFRIKYADEEHFKLEFEMYFRDDEGKPYRCANESDARTASLFKKEAWETIKDLKNVEFNMKKSDKTLELEPVLNKENGNGIGTKN